MKLCHQLSIKEAPSGFFDKLNYENPERNALRAFCF
mgnify:CR=1 FL=1